MFRSLQSRDLDFKLSFTQIFYHIKISASFLITGMLFLFSNEVTIIFIITLPNEINLFNKYLLKGFSMCLALVLGANGIKLKKTEIKLREM